MYDHWKFLKKYQDINIFLSYSKKVIRQIVYPIQTSLHHMRAELKINQNTGKFSEFINIFPWNFWLERKGNKVSVKDNIFIQIKVYTFYN